MLNTPKQTLLNSVTRGGGGLPELVAPRLGDRVQLPKYDKTGRLIPSCRILVLSIPNCASCSAQSLDLKHISANRSHPILIVLDGEIPNNRVRSINNDHVFWANASLCKLPDALIYYANTLVVVNEQREIEAFAEATTAEQFVRNWK